MSSIFVAPGVVAPYDTSENHDELQQNAAQWDSVASPPFGTDAPMNSPWRCAISPALRHPGDAEPGDITTFCVTMDDTFIENSYVKSRESHVAICEAACILGASATFKLAAGPGRAPLLVITAMSAFVYALSVRLLDGHFDRLQLRTSSWFTDELRALVDEVVARLDALRDRFDALADGDAVEQFYAGQVPRVFLSVDSMTTTRAELKPWATYALASIILACPRLHTWSSVAVVPPCMLAAYACMSMTVSDALFAGNEIVESADQTLARGALTKRQDVPNSVHAGRAAMMFLFIYNRVLLSTAISTANDCTPLFARWMIWRNSAVEPVLRGYITSSYVRSELPVHGLPTATRLANLTETALFYAITNAGEYAIPSHTRQLWGSQISALRKHVNAAFRVSTSMLLTCSPVPLPSTRPASEIAMPDLSLPGIRVRMVRIGGVGSIGPKLVNRITGEGSSDLAELQWARVTQPVSTDDCNVVALYNTDVDYTKEAINLVHCLRLQGAAYAGHTEWCAPSRLIQSMKRVVIDGGALRVLALMSLRTTVATNLAMASSFPFLTPIVYREMRALPHIQSPKLRAEVASALCSLIGMMTAPRMSCLPWSAVMPAVKRLGFNMTVGSPSASAAEIMLAGPFRVLLCTVVPWISNHVQTSAEMREACGGIATFTSALLALSSVSVSRVRLPRELWMRVLRLFFVMDRYISEGRDNELPTIMSSNPSAVQALSFMYIHSSLTHRDVVDAYTQSNSVPQQEPDLMGIDAPVAMAREKRGAPRSKRSDTINRQAVHIVRMAAHRRPACLEDFVATRDNLRTVGAELQSVISYNSGDKAVSLYDMSAMVKEGARLIRRASVAAFANATRFADLGTATNELRGSRRSDVFAGSGKRSRRKLNEDGDEDNGDHDSTDDDPPLYVPLDDLDDEANQGDASSPSSEELADPVAKIAMFAFCAILMAATEDPETYAPVAAKMITSCNASVGPHSNIRATYRDIERRAVAGSIRDSVELVLENRDKRPLPGMYQPEWFPEEHTPEAQADDAVIRSLFLLEVTPVTMAANGFNLYRTLGNNLPASHRFREFAGYDLAYIDPTRRTEQSNRPVIHYAFSMTHGVRDGHVAGVADPPTGPAGVAAPTRVPYRMASARWASQMQIQDSPIDATSGRAAAEFAATFL